MTITCDCGRPLTEEEQHYYGNTCEWCERYMSQALSDELSDDKDPQILIDAGLKYGDGYSSATGLHPSDMNREFLFLFKGQKPRVAVLVGSNVHCDYDEDGNPRSLLISLEFQPREPNNGGSTP